MATSAAVGDSECLKNIDNNTTLSVAIVKNVESKLASMALSASEALPLTEKLSRRVEKFIGSSPTGSPCCAPITISNVFPKSYVQGGVKTGQITTLTIDGRFHHASCISNEKGSILRALEMCHGRYFALDETLSKFSETMNKTKTFDLVKQINEQRLTSQRDRILDLLKDVTYATAQSVTLSLKQTVEEYKQYAEDVDVYTHLKEIYESNSQQLDMATYSKKLSSLVISYYEEKFANICNGAVLSCISLQDPAFINSLPKPLKKTVLREYVKNDIMWRLWAVTFKPDSSKALFGAPRSIDEALSAEPSINQTTKVVFRKPSGEQISQDVRVSDRINSRPVNSLGDIEGGEGGYINSNKGMFNSISVGKARGLDDEVSVVDNGGGVAPLTTDSLARTQATDVTATKEKELVVVVTYVVYRDAQEFMNLAGKIGINNFFNLEDKKKIISSYPQIADYLVLDNENSLEPNQPKKCIILHSERIVLYGGSGGFSDNSSARVVFSMRSGVLPPFDSGSKIGVLLTFPGNTGTDLMAGFSEFGSSVTFQNIQKKTSLSAQQQVNMMNILLMRACITCSWTVSGGSVESSVYPYVADPYITNLRGNNCGYPLTGNMTSVFMNDNLKDAARRSTVSCNSGLDPNDDNAEDNVKAEADIQEENLDTVNSGYAEDASVALLKQ
jgi:hypothetical protein